MAELLFCHLNSKLPIISIIPSARFQAAGKGIALAVLSTYFHWQLARLLNMSKLIVIQEDKMRQIIEEVISDSISSLKTLLIEMNNTKEEQMVTSIKQISELLNCSLPTAQKIKNNIPGDLYFQEGRKFAIPLSVLLGNKKSNSKKT